MDRQFRWVLVAVAGVTVIGTVGYQLLPSPQWGSPKHSELVGKWEGDSKAGATTTTPSIHIDRGSELSLMIDGPFEAVLIHFTPLAKSVSGPGARRTINLSPQKITEAAKSPQLFKRDMDEGDYQFEFQGRGTWRVEVRR